MAKNQGNQESFAAVKDVHAHARSGYLPVVDFPREEGDEGSYEVFNLSINVAVPEEGLSAEQRAEVIADLVSRITG